MSDTIANPAPHVAHERRLPPTPPGNLLLGNTLQYLRDPLHHVVQWTREHGDIVRLRLPGLRTYLAVHPEHVEYVLRGNHRNFIKDRITRRLSLFLGQGLLTSEGDFWRRQRRLSQPAFQQQQIEQYAGVMVSLAGRMLDGWQDGDERDIHAEMMQLTLAVVAKTLFDADVSSTARGVGESLDVIMAYFLNPAVNWSRLPAWLPVPATRRFQRAVRQLDEIIYGIIRQRRAGGGSPNDLLSRLLAARDEDGSRMTDVQLRDELVTLILAGHETTALTLSYTFYLLAQHPLALDCLHAELSNVLAGRDPTLADLPRLVYADAVIKEAMRLYPPAWAVAREAVEDCQLGGFHVPAGTQVWLSQWVVHRDPRWWPDAEAFFPDRWSNDLARRLPRGTYFPFGDGPRVCIGSQFATTEAVLLLATIAQRYRLELVAGPPIRPLPSITLRPDRPIWMIVHSRR